MLLGNWGPQKPPHGKAKPSDAGKLPAALAHNPIASVVELQSRGSHSGIFLLPGNQAEERCGLVVFFFPSPRCFIWLDAGKSRGQLTFWSGMMGSALQTAPCNPQRRCSSSSFPQIVVFSHPLTVLKMNASGSPGAEGGGTHSSTVLGCCRQPTNRLMSHSQWFLGTLWETPNMLQDNISRQQSKGKQ